MGTIETNIHGVLLPPLEATVSILKKEFNQIPVGRKAVLAELTRFVEDKAKAAQKVNLNFICTHNSRRSHLAQLWAQAAAHYYGIPGVECFSGGTEATAFNIRAVEAMRGAGFNISETKAGTNPIYQVCFSENGPVVVAFSKRYDDPFNPYKDFAAIMTCSHADENCPLVMGASSRIALTYEDPKEFDGTEKEAMMYKERVHQIGREIFFAFSEIESK